MKIKNNNINLDTVSGVQSIDDHQAEKCVGGNFIAKRLDTSVNGTPLNVPDFLVTGNEGLVYAGFSSAVSFESTSNGSDSFTIDWTDASGNVLSTVSVSSFETAVVPESAIFAAVTQG